MVFNLATAEKDHKNVSKNTSERKGRLRRITILYLMWRETDTKHKTEVFSAFFASGFNSKNSCSPVTLLFSTTV